MGSRVAQNLAGIVNDPFTDSPFTHSLIHSFTHSLIHSFTHSLIHSFTHSLIHVSRITHHVSLITHHSSLPRLLPLLPRRRLTNLRVKRSCDDTLGRIGQGKIKFPWHPPIGRLAKGHP